MKEWKLSRILIPVYQKMKSISEFIAGRVEHKEKGYVSIIKRVCHYSSDYAESTEP